MVHEETYFNYTYKHFWEGKKVIADSFCYWLSAGWSFPQEPVLVLTDVTSPSINTKKSLIFLSNSTRTNDLVLAYFVLRIPSKLKRSLSLLQSTFLWYQRYLFPLTNNSRLAGTEMSDTISDRLSTFQKHLDNWAQKVWHFYYSTVQEAAELKYRRESQRTVEYKTLFYVRVFFHQTLVGRICQFIPTVELFLSNLTCRACAKLNSGVLVTLYLVEKQFIQHKKVKVWPHWCGKRC